MVDKITNFLEEKDCGITLLKKIWDILYEDYEEFPGKSQSTIDLIIDALSDTKAKKIQKIYSIIFKEEDD
jgi:hypothetical protein